jgi:hypothetical protein
LAFAATDQLDERQKRVHALNRRVAILRAAASIQVNALAKVTSEKVEKSYCPLAAFMPLDWLGS